MSLDISSSGLDLVLLRGSRHIVCFLETLDGCILNLYKTYTGGMYKYWDATGECVHGGGGLPAPRPAQEREVSGH